MSVRDITTDRPKLMATVGNCLDELYAGTNWALKYTDTDNNEVTFLSGDAALTLLENYAERKFICPDLEHVTEDAFYVAGQFHQRYLNMWARRKAQFGWLDQMLKRTDYDPLENYDRKEDGGWKDTTDLGAKTRTANLTDSYATYTDTDTETPTVKTKVTETPTVKTKTTETPTVKTKVTETPTVKTKVTETPTVKTKVTETPTVKTKTTETPGVTETVVDTPRAATRTTEAPGVSTTVAENIYGDNSSTMVPSRSTTTSPGTGQTNVTTVEGISGTDQKQTSRTGTNETVNEVLSGNTETTTEVVSGNTETTTEVVSGNTETTTEVVSGNTETVNEVVSGTNETVTEIVSGNTQISRVKGAHIDTHNTTYGEQAAQDTLTRLFQNYRVHGNIGVRAVADMLTTEVGLRSRLDLPELFIQDFIESVTFYAE